MLTLSTSNVRSLQSALIALDLYPAESLDGEIGPLTIKAVSSLADALEDKQFTYAPEGSLAAAIVAAATQYVGLSETRPNSAWDDKSTPGVDPGAVKLRAALASVGWTSGEAYCAAFAEAAWAVGFSGLARSAEFVPISKLLTLSVMQSFNNFSKAGLISKVPRPGAIFFMQHGFSGLGHAGIVERVDGSTLHTIEGNTSPTSADVAKDREGDGVYQKTRALDFAVTAGLHLRGFINPPA